MQGPPAVRRTARPGRLARAVTIVVCVAMLITTIGAFVQEGRGATYPLGLSFSGDRAEVKVPAPGTVIVPCARGGSVTHHAYAEVPLASGSMSNLPGTARVNLDVHSDAAPSAFLMSDQSHATLSNQRGKVQLQLTAGSCDNQSVGFDGTVASGSGTWSVDPDYTTDAYREATGSGTFTFSTSFAEGNAKPWSLQIQGGLSVLQPSLSATFIRSYWGHLGADYAGRVGTVVYRLKNEGPGDAFRVKFLTPTTVAGINTVEFSPSDLDDLGVGETVDVTVRYKIEPQEKASKGPLIVRREFDTTLNVILPDALDVATTKNVLVRVSVPSFPPPL